jgi:hypothetical protein
VANDGIDILVEGLLRDSACRERKATVSITVGSNAGVVVGS